MEYLRPISHILYIGNFKQISKQSTEFYIQNFQTFIQFLIFMYNLIDLILNNRDQSLVYWKPYFKTTLMVQKHC